MGLATKVRLFCFPVFGVGQPPKPDPEGFLAVMNRQSQIIERFFFLGVFLKASFADLVLAITANVGVREAVSS